MKEYTIWPVYIDKEKSKNKGRKLNKELCIIKPKVKDIYNAIRKLGYDAEIVKNKCYPKEWWEVTSYIKIITNDNISKIELLKKICNIIKK